MSTAYYQLEGVGKISITRRKASKRISMRVKPDGSVSVNHPWYASAKEVMAFIEANTEWIKQQQKKITAKKPLYTIGQIIELKQFEIQIKQIEQGSLRAVRRQTLLVITVPQTEPVESEKVQHFIFRVITEACRIEAKIFLPQRVRQLADQHGFSYDKVFVKNLKSKWGSCSSQGNINLNLHLMRLPDELIDYIILHELCHTVEMNHGPQFWQLMNKVCKGKAKQLNRAMKMQNHLIYS